jgi:hypothetical protein
VHISLRREAQESGFLAVKKRIEARGLVVNHSYPRGLRQTWGNFGSLKLFEIMRCNKSALGGSGALKHREVFNRAHSPHLSVSPRLSSLYQELRYTGRRELASEG